MGLRKGRLFSAGVVGLSLFFGAACGGGGGSSTAGSTSGGGSLERTVLENYVNGYILDVYARLDANSAVLSAAVDEFIANPTEENLAAARAAWIQSRVPWEESEAALFGPVDFNGFDPALDSWPVNRVDLEAVLNSSTDLSLESVANFDASVKGFHTIEFLLFGTGGSQSASGFSSRQFEYLRASTADLRNIASQLLRSWTEGIDGSTPYAQEFLTAGQGSSIYPSERSAIEEIARGIITIADEVANGKIADPFDTRDTELVESQFSFNSITDFTSDIRGIQFSYERALSAFVADQNSDLDQRIRAQINAALSALGAIPEPFRDAILDPSNDSLIVEAQAQIRGIQSIFENEVLPLIL
jgi:predicted lipoprotein